MQIQQLQEEHQFEGEDYWQLQTIGVIISGLSETVQARYAHSQNLSRHKVLYSRMINVSFVCYGNSTVLSLTEYRQKRLIAYDWEPTYVKYLTGGDVDPVTNQITWTAHNLQNNYALLFNTPFKGQSSMGLEDGLVAWTILTIKSLIFSLVTVELSKLLTVFIFNK